MRDDGGGRQPPSRCPSSSSAAERGPCSAGCPAPGHAARTCRGANDNGCGPLSQPVWPGTWRSGSEHMGSPHTGSWDAGALQGLGELCLGSQCLGLTEEAGCWSPSLFRTHQGYRFNNVKRHMASCPLQPSGSPTGQNSLAGLGGPWGLEGAPLCHIPGGQHPPSTPSCGMGSSTPTGHSH